MTFAEETIKPWILAGNRVTRTTVRRRRMPTWMLANTPNPPSSPRRVTVMSC
jgi:hypothetical protein